MSEFLIVPVIIIFLSLLVILLIFENYRNFKKIDKERSENSRLIFELNNRNEENRKLRSDNKRLINEVQDRETTIQANADLIKTLYMQKAELMKSLVATDEILPTDSNQVSLFETLKH